MRFRVKDIDTGTWRIVDTDEMTQVEVTSVRTIDADHPDLADYEDVRIIGPDGNAA